MVVYYDVYSIDLSQFVGTKLVCLQQASNSRKATVYFALGVVLEWGETILRFNSVIQCG